MNQDQFDRTLMDDVSQLPPPTAQDYTPWQAAVTKILWGMGLTTFKLEFFYLQYLLPLLGAVLMYTGYRSLRRCNRWFGLCWGLSGLLLAWHMAVDILSATPVVQTIAQSEFSRPLSILTVAVNLVLLVSLRAGIRQAFSSTCGGKPKDWLGRGLVAYVLSLIIAVWATLVPYTQPGMFGQSITNGYLYYGRGAVFIALQIYLLVCIARQGESLAGLGYEIAPAPVGISSRALIVAVFATVLLALPPAMWLGGRLPMGEVQQVSAPLSGEQAQVRDRLIALGLPQTVADCLDEEELALCAQAISVEQALYSDLNLTDDEVATLDGPAILVEPDGGLAELSSWLIILPDGQIRYYHFFAYRQMPKLRLQEQFSVDPSGNYPDSQYSARLLWEKQGHTYTTRPIVALAGGQTADELDEITSWISQHELERLGHIHHSPWFSFSIPRGAEGLRGYLAYSNDIAEPSVDEEGNFYDFAFPFLRHQSSWLHYPFRSIDTLGGSRYSGDYGPIQSHCAPFYWLTPLPY